MAPPIEAEEPSMRTKALVGIIAGLSLLATACGDDDVEDASDATVTSDPAATSPPAAYCTRRTVRASDQWRSSW